MFTSHQAPTILNATLPRRDNFWRRFKKKGPGNFPHLLPPPETGSKTCTLPNDGFMTADKNTAILINDATDGHN